MKKKWVLSVCCALLLVYWLSALLLKHRSSIANSIFRKDFSLSTDRPEVDDGEQTPVQVEVTVYYEALCPDSKHFLQKQLLPARHALTNSIIVHLIPYGKAKTFVDPTGKLEFQCQHGPTECYANKIHACSLEFIKNNQEQISFTTCMIMDNMNPDAALTRCGKSFSIDTNLISECANSENGSQLLKKYGEATHKINPNFIPTVHIEETKDNLASILKNFLLEVCKHFPESKLPPGCI